MKPIHYPHSTTTVDESRAMQNRHDKITMTEVLQAFASSGLGLTPISIRTPESVSTRHVIYLVTVKELDEEFVFRSNIGYSKSPEVVLAREKLMTDAARAAGVPVNKIMYADTSRSAVNFDFQIQKKVPGLDLKKAFGGRRLTIRS